MIALDIETHPIAPGCLAPKPVVVSVSGAGLTLWGGFNALPSGDIVGHNTAFDMACVAHHRPSLMAEIFDRYEHGAIHDTMAAMALRDIATIGYRWPEYDLATCVQRALGKTLEKDDDIRLRYGELDGVPIDKWPQRFVGYAVLDAEITLELWSALTATQPDRYVDEPRQARKAWWLYLMSAWGLRTDIPAVDAFERATQGRYDDLLGTLITAGLVRAPRQLRTGRVADPTRNIKAVRDSVAEALGESALRTKKGAVSTSADACELAALAAEAAGLPTAPALRAYSDFSSVGKVLSTDVPLLRRGLIQARFTTPLETGRTSSSPNIQNLPREGSMRECCIPRPGRAFVGADVGGLELGTLAQVLLRAVGWSALADAIRSGRDPHCMTGANILGCSYDEIVAGAKAGSKPHKNARQLAKVPNFGIPGGLGAARLVDFARSTYGQAITLDQAAQLKDTHARTFPEIRDYFRWIDSLCHDTGNVDARGKPDRRATIVQLFSGRIRANCRYTEACNTLFQGLGADATAEMGWQISRACYVPTEAVHGGPSPLLGCRPVNYIHDEFIVEVPIRWVHECAEEIANLMHRAAKVWLPDIPLYSEPVAMDRWYKDARRVTDAQGRLVVYAGG